MSQRQNFSASYIGLRSILNAKIKKKRLFSIHPQAAVCFGLHTATQTAAHSLKLSKAPPPPFLGGVYIGPLQRLWSPI